MANEPLNDEYETARAKFLESFEQTEKFKFKKNKYQNAYYRELRSLRRVVRDRHGIRSVQNETTRFLAVVQEWDNYIDSHWQQFGGQPENDHYSSAKTNEKSDFWKSMQKVIKDARWFNAQVPELSEHLIHGLEIEHGNARY